MFERFRKFRQFDDLAASQRVASVRVADRERRARVPIAVIDDESFKPEQNLRALGYSINVIGDIKSIDEIRDHNIILCDLQGVGMHLDGKGQGAFIIDEIKRNHPEKFVIAYTGGSLDDAITIRAQQYADFFLRKDANIDEWRDMLDTIVDFLCNPVLVWKRQRAALIDVDVPTLEILKLEDAYVRSIMEGNDEGYRKAIQKMGANPDIRAIAQSLIASGIFALLFS
jgi:hypothetical protein